MSAKEKLCTVCIHELLSTEFDNQLNYCLKRVSRTAGLWLSYYRLGKSLGPPKMISRGWNLEDLVLGELFWLSYFGGYCLTHTKKQHLLFDSNLRTYHLCLFYILCTTQDLWKPKHTQEINLQNVTCYIQTPAPGEKSQALLSVGCQCCWCCAVVCCRWRLQYTSFLTAYRMKSPNRNGKRIR